MCLAPGPAETKAMLWPGASEIVGKDVLCEVERTTGNGGSVAVGVTVEEANTVGVHSSGSATAIVCVEWGSMAVVGSCVDVDA